MKMIGFHLILLCLSVGFVQAERPDESEVTRVILALDDDAHKVRRDAFVQLESWAEAYPLFMLTQFSEAYLKHAAMEVRTRLETLMEPLVKEYVLTRPSGFLGINMEFTSLQDHGPAIRIVAALPGNPAARSGMRDGDHIVKVDGVTIRELEGLEGFSSYIASQPPGTIVRFKLVREDEVFERILALGLREGVGGSHSAQLSADYMDWLQDLSGRGEDFDPDFPVGHFPLDDEK